jgi:peptidoglycan/xylan/chitin deacetylase (PgdA/CDA1 family)
MIPLLIGGAAGAAVFAGFHAYLPMSQLYGKTFIGTPGRGKKVAITFDDGPNPACTPALLDVLAKNNVRATFFMIGRFVRQQPELARRVSDGGHEVANHTYSHPHLSLCSAARTRRELKDCDSALNDAGVANQYGLFRAPFGARRPATLTIARELGLTPIQWSVTTFDWNAPSAERIEQNAFKRLRGGDVLLFHDGGHTGLNADRMHTVKAVAELLPRLRAEGYEFVTVGDWLKASDASSGSPSRPDKP